MLYVKSRSVGISELSNTTYITRLSDGEENIHRVPRMVYTEHEHEKRRPAQINSHGNLSPKRSWVEKLFCDRDRPRFEISISNASFDFDGGRPEIVEFCEESSSEQISEIVNSMETSKLRIPKLYL